MLASQGAWPSSLIESMLQPSENWSQDSIIKLQSLPNGNPGSGNGVWRDKTWELRARGRERQRELKVQANNVRESANKVNNHTTVAVLYNQI